MNLSINPLDPFRVLSPNLQEERMRNNICLNFFRARVISRNVLAKVRAKTNQCCTPVTRERVGQGRRG